MSDKEQSESHASGGKIGKYQIIRTLGEGSFGKVKLAYHLTTGQKVALKIINRKTLAKSDMQGRIEREISYLRLLRHPHIIKLYDVIKSQDEIIMVIEYAGKELFDYIVQKGKMKELEARRFFQQIISAVEYCHRHKIVHRDLKPENLLLDDSLNVKIADFGLSNFMSDGNFLKTSCGSPNYAAPEVISGKLYAGPEVDVWSCGVILYVMLCGRLPFDDEFIPALFKKISNGVYTLPNYLSEGAKNILTKMLVVNPLNRITIHEIMQDEWFTTEISDYLLPNDVPKSLNDSKKIDENLINILVKTMGYDKNEILETLNKNLQNEIMDGYMLIKENKMIIDDLKKKPNDADQLDTFLSSSPPPSYDHLDQQHQHHQHQHKEHQEHQQHKDKEEITYQQPLSSNHSGAKGLHNTIAILPSSLPQLHRANMAQYGNSNSITKINPISTKKSKTRWHFGIRSRSYPLDVMGEIYRALKNLGAEWTKPNEDELWTIKVRWKYSPNTENTNPTTRKIPDMMKMIIQLFQLEPNNYLVDFKFDGWEFNSDDVGISGVDKGLKNDDEISSFSAYPFLHLATRLIMELAVNSQGG
ncbi:carbon catabolite-derepressing protein kinase [Wickerhamomyces ciferrii]|uniref:Carbon catabolite-derepressing protein kinase n=1 Tax=Wickerhamomyces ciferrii (strain ATCC 14091 / BCRC 22168 / CBS 111 / JCM 3599 / NBRC 0793 / NRRL Y-1031 F-60-10) TaxID=1206466 RepID=K0KNS0_WICCF|nr:carbon catabolite-derepressing protein kinase [Wickerhamomyces ciferrii]CCH44631.1 carbon catabolite-derepressing protein kinase [Wickerhamomyces ciferrii]